MENNGSKDNGREEDKDMGDSGSKDKDGEQDREMEDNGSKEDDGDEDKDGRALLSLGCKSVAYIQDFTLERQKLQQDQYFECDSCKSNQ